MKKFYITTSIVYTNGPPHLGFAFELIQADVVARYQRALKKEVFFLTGTDEHGLKVARKAKEMGKTPKEFCDEIVKKYKELIKLLNISNDDFIRTTDKKRHLPGVYKLWEKIKNKGDIYKKEYQGFYCVGCEAFTFKRDLRDGKCPHHNIKPELTKEENYFFKLSKYTKKIEKIIRDDILKITPLSKKREMLSFLREGLEDISFSRPTEKVEWGIPVPGDNSQKIYVWADALTNYISAIGYGGAENNFKKHWPADIHFIGKDILKFHALIWPGMLLSAGITLPKSIFVHGFLTVGGQKMSKTLGNVVDPLELVKKYGTDAVRYYFLREIPPTQDGDFTYEKFENRYNSDLAAGLGNLVSRVITMAAKSDSKFQALNFKQTPHSKLQTIINKSRRNFHKSLGEFKFNEALISIWDLISFCDKYIERERPWEKRDKQHLTINNLLFIVNNIADLLKPFLPQTAQKILKQLKDKTPKPLFPRL